MSFTLPELNYPYNALEPYIDAKTMEIHHQKHHGTYVAKLNDAVKKSEDIMQIMQSIDMSDAAVRNNGGGHFNHSLLWQLLTPNGSKLTENMENVLNAQFGSFDNFKTQIIKAALTRFGSGWAWLVIKDDELNICSTPNQDNPLMTGDGFPIFGIDVWEHAYYLKYQNRRNEYLEAIFNVVNWQKVEELFNNYK